MVQGLCVLRYPRLVVVIRRGSAPYGDPSRVDSRGGGRGSSGSVCVGLCVLPSGSVQCESEPVG